MHSTVLEQLQRAALKRAAQTPPEDENADPVGDGHSDAEFAARMPQPAKPSPVPKPPAGPHGLVRQV